MPSRKTLTRRHAARIAREEGRRLPPETLDEALSRVPVGRKWLTTPDLQDILGCHEVTVYRYVGHGKLTANHAPAHGRASLYRTEEVIEFIKKRFAPRPNKSEAEG